MCVKQLNLPAKNVNIAKESFWLSFGIHVSKPKATQL